MLLKLRMSMFRHGAEAYSEPSQTSNMECFAKIYLQKTPSLMPD